MYVANNFWSLDVNGCPQHLCTCCQLHLCILVVQTQYNLGLFEATKTSGQTMALKLQALLNKFGLKKKVYSCQKCKPTKFLKVRRRILKAIMNCESSRLEEPFQSTCFGHVILKMCQYGTTNNKVCVGLHNIFVKLA